MGLFLARASYWAAYCVWVLKVILWVFLRGWHA